jgi:hypothetical protein
MMVHWSAKLLLLSLLLSCALNHLTPEQKTVTGTVVWIEHDERYEAPCGIRAAIYHECDEPPVCCSYHVTLADSLGNRIPFWAFWGKYAEGLYMGEQLTLRLRRGAVYHLLSCAATQAVVLSQCAHDVDYMVTGDSDVVKL